METDIDDRKRAEALLAGEKRLLEMVARGHSMSGNTRSALPACRRHGQRLLLQRRVGRSERHASRTRSRAEPSGQLHHLHYWPARERRFGSCAMAAYLNEQVIAADLTSETRWAAYEWCPMALAHGLQACWSTPISSTAGKVLGAFAIYYDEPKTPTPTPAKPHRAVHAHREHRDRTCAE